MRRPHRLKQKQYHHYQHPHKDRMGYQLNRNKRKTFFRRNAALCVVIAIVLVLVLLAAAAFFFRPAWLFQRDANAATVPIASAVPSTSVAPHSAPSSASAPASSVPASAAPNSNALDDAASSSPSASPAPASPSGSSGGVQEGEIAPYEFRTLYVNCPDGEEVTTLQRRLASLGYLSLTEYTEHFGPTTQEAVKLFQKAHGLTDDGIVGEETYRILFSSEAIRVTA